MKARGNQEMGSGIALERRIWLTFLRGSPLGPLPLFSIKNVERGGEWGGYSPRCKGSDTVSKGLRLRWWWCVWRVLVWYLPGDGAIRTSWSWKDLVVGIWTSVRANLCFKLGIHQSRVFGVRSSWSCMYNIESFEYQEGLPYPKLTAIISLNVEQEGKRSNVERGKRRETGGLTAGDEREGEMSGKEENFSYIRQVT